MDLLKLALSSDGALRVRAAITTDLVKEAVRRHETSRLGTVALGRALTVAALYPLEKGKVESVSLQFMGGGPLKSVYAEARHTGALRGFVANAQAEPRGSLSFGHQGAGLGLLPGGALHVVRVDGKGNHTVGRVPLKNGEVDEDLESFFVLSEQVPTRIRAEVHLDEAGEVIMAWGALAQRLPDADLDALARFSPPQRESTPTLDALLEGALGGPKVLGAQDAQILEELPLRFSCACSLERVKGSLLMLEPADLREMLEEDKGASVTCHFCQETYRVDEAELSEILEKRAQTPTGQT
jgi:molecular chaperone Hsp33